MFSPEAIKSDSDITGVHIGLETCILSLFTDDTVIYFTNPITSLPPLTDLIHAFGRILGFSINNSKSEPYPITLLPEICAILQSKYDLCWVSKTWGHLGVLIPLDLKDLFSSNYVPLSKRIQATLKSWTMTFLNWLKHIMLIKLIILPQYLFCSRPFLYRYQISFD